MHHILYHPEMSRNIRGICYRNAPSAIIYNRNDKTWTFTTKHHSEKEPSVVSLSSCRLPVSSASLELNRAQQNPTRYPPAGRTRRLNHGSSPGAAAQRFVRHYLAASSDSVIQWVSESVIQWVNRPALPVNPSWRDSSPASLVPWRSVCIFLCVGAGSRLQVSSIVSSRRR